MDLTTEALRLGISMARMRAEVASANIANVDVAGYRTQRADFAQATGLLREAAEQPDMDAQALQAMTPCARQIPRRTRRSASTTKWRNWKPPA